MPHLYLGPTEILFSKSIVTEAEYDIYSDGVESHTYITNPLKDDQSVMFAVSPMVCLDFYPLKQTTECLTIDPNKFQVYYNEKEIDAFETHVVALFNNKRIDLTPLLSKYYPIKENMEYFEFYKLFSKKDENKKMDKLIADEAFCKNLRNNYKIYNCKDLKNLSFYMEYRFPEILKSKKKNLLTIIQRNQPPSFMGTLNISNIENSSSRSNENICPTPRFKEVVGELAKDCLIDSRYHGIIFGSVHDNQKVKINIHRESLTPRRRKFYMSSCFDFKNQLKEIEGGFSYSTQKFMTDQKLLVGLFNCRNK